MQNNKMIGLAVFGLFLSCWVGCVGGRGAQQASERGTSQTPIQVSASDSRDLSILSDKIVELEGQIEELKSVAGDKSADESTIAELKAEINALKQELAGQGHDGHSEDSPSDDPKELATTPAEESAPASEGSKSQDSKLERASSFQTEHQDEIVAHPFESPKPKDPKSDSCSNSQPNHQGETSAYSSQKIAMP